MKIEPLYVCKIHHELNGYHVCQIIKVNNKAQVVYVKERAGVRDSNTSKKKEESTNLQRNLHTGEILFHCLDNHCRICDTLIPGGLGRLSRASGKASNKDCGDTSFALEKQ
jgi:hypothetical protein